MDTVKLRKETYTLLNDPLLGEGDVDSKILRLVAGELSRQLEQYRILDQVLATKYATSFAEFMERRTTVQHSNSWEIENDATEWEKAMSGIVAIERRLQKIDELTPAVA